MGILSKIFGPSLPNPSTQPARDEPQDRTRVSRATETFAHFADKVTKAIRSVTPLEVNGGTRCILVEHAYKRGVNPALAGVAAGIGVAGTLGNALGSAMELREYFVIVPAASDASKDFTVRSSRMNGKGDRVAGTSLSISSPSESPASVLLSSKLQAALVAEGGKVIVERCGDCFIAAMAAEADITMGGRSVRNRLLRVASALT